MKKIIYTLAVLSLTGCLEGGGGSGGTIAAPSTDPSIVSPDLPVAPPVVVIPPVTPNSAPVLAITDSLNGSEGQELILRLIGSDANGDVLTYTCQTGCIAGMVVNAQNEFRWTPSFSQAGTYPISFRVSDGTAYQDYSGNVIIANVNRAPVMAALTSTTVMENQNVQYIPTATDADGDTGIIQLVGGLPANATFSGGLLSFTPSFAQGNSSYTFTFRAFDGAAYSANQSVTVTVSNSNRAPVLASIGPKSVNETVNLNFAISATDPDGDALLASAISLPTGSTFNSTTGVFNWTPTCAQSGSYNVTFQVSDGALSASEVVAINVVNQNCDSPAWQSVSTILSNSGENVIVQITNAVDNDGVTYGYLNETDCNNANWINSFNTTNRQFNVTRTVTGGGQTDFGTHLFVLYAQDGFGARTYLRISLTKNGANFLLGTESLGSTYSQAITGYCGAGTIYTHP